MSGLRAALAALAPAVALLAGCGGGDGAAAPGSSARQSSPTVQAPAPATSGAAAAEPPPAVTSGAPVESPPDEQSPDGGSGDGPDPFAGAVALEEPMQFSSPTGNISCAIDVGYARCDIVERDWEPPPPPEDCDVDFGQGLEVDDTGAALVCAGDTVLGATQTLPYGEAVQGGRIACASQRSGVRCEHLDTGAGFVLSRASYDLY